MAVFNNVVLNEDNIAKLCRACLGSSAGRMEPIFSANNELSNSLALCTGIEASLFSYLKAKIIILFL